MIAVALLAVLLVGCAPEGVTAVSIHSLPERSVYHTGEDLDLTGCVLTVVYSGGTTQQVPVTADMVSGFDSATVGKKTLTVTYTAEEGRTFTTTMVVEIRPRKAISIEVHTAPARTQYVEGQPIDFSDIEVTVLYSDGTSSVRNASSLVFSPTVATAGTQSVTVRYEDVSCSVPITLVERKAEGISLSLAEGWVPYLYRHVQYNADYTLLSNWLVADALYNDATTGAARITDVSPADFWLVEATTLSVTAEVDGEEFRATLTLTPIEDELLSMNVHAPLYVEQGSAIDLSAVTVDLTFAHFTAEGYSLDLDLIPLSVSLPNTATAALSQPLTVQLGAVSAGALVDVGIERVVALEAESEDIFDNNVFAVGEVPYPEKLMLYAVYNSGRKELIWRMGRPISTEVIPPEEVVLGQTTATITYGEFTYTYAIEVIPAEE